MKLFSPELWPQKIQIRSAKQQICPFHWPFIIRKWRQKGCRLPTKKRWVVFQQMMAHHMFNFNPGLYFVRWQAHHVHHEIPLALWVTLLNFFNPYFRVSRFTFPVFDAAPFIFDSSNSFLRVKTGFEDGSIPMFDSQITWNHLFLCFNPNLLMVTSAFFMVKSHVLMILMVRSNF